MEILIVVLTAILVRVADASEIKVDLAGPKNLFGKLPSHFSIKLINEAERLPSLEDIGRKHDESSRKFLSDEHLAIVRKYHEYSRVHYVDDFFSNNPAISGEILNESTGEITKFDIQKTSFTLSGSIDVEDDKRLKRDLMPGESFRSYVDLSTYMNGLESGDYEIAIKVHQNEFVGFESNRHKFTLTELSEEAMEQLRELFSSEAIPGNVNDWIKEDLNYNLLENILPEEVLSQIIGVIFLNKAAAFKLEVEDLSELDKLGTEYSALRESLICELYHLWGLNDKFEESVSVIRSSYPDSVWRIDRILNFEGLLAEALIVKNQTVYGEIDRESVLSRFRDASRNSIRKIGVSSEKLEIEKMDRRAQNEVQNFHRYKFYIIACLFMLFALFLFYRKNIERKRKRSIRKS